MNKKLKFVVITLLTIIVAGIIAWNYVNKPNTDLSGKTPEAVYSYAQIVAKMSNDTASLSLLKDKFIALNGSIKKISKDSVSTSVEIGDTTSMSSITCRIDDRHQSDFTNVKEGASVSIKGKITGFTIDTDLGLGNTMLMNFCTLNKNK